MPLTRGLDFREVKKHFRKWMVVAVDIWGALDYCLYLYCAYYKLTRKIFMKKQCLKKALETRNNKTRKERKEQVHAP